MTGDWVSGEYLLRKGGQFVGSSHATLGAADAEARKIGASEVVRIEVMRQYPRLFSEDERTKIVERIDKREYAAATLVGDGMQLDLAEAELWEMSDRLLVTDGILGGAISMLGQWEDVAGKLAGAERDVRAALQDLPPDRVEEIVAFVRLDWASSF